MATKPKSRSRKAPSVRRVVMAKVVAARWLENNAQPEYRVTIHYMGKEGRRIPSLLRGFRDGHLKIGTNTQIADLGVSESFDAVTVWSRDRDQLLKLALWFDEHGYETSGVW
jgi:hypothetical protein